MHACMCVSKYFPVMQDGRLVTASGCTAGIDAALAVIENFYGTEFAENLVNYIEYSGDFGNTVKPTPRYFLPPYFLNTHMQASLQQVFF